MLNNNHLIVSNLSALKQATQNSMHHLRYNTFKTRLGWDVPVANEMEIDQFDQLDPVVILAQVDNQVAGCMRLLPTTGEYMLKDTFPQLLNGEKAPQNPNIMEISRYAVNTQSGACDKAGINNISMALLRQLYLYAAKSGIKEYVFATTVSFKRYLKRIGIQVVDFGDGNSSQIGIERSIGLRLKVNSDFAGAVGCVAVH